MAAAYAVSELVHLKVHHIDGERQLLRIEQGKGNKDRMVALSVTLLNQLRHYWLVYRPSSWLFPNSYTPKRYLGITSIQKVYTRAKSKVGIQKVGGIHGLRHAYATHQLEQGLIGTPVATPARSPPIADHLALCPLGIEL